MFFELQDLSADRRLLNPVGHLPHRFADAAVFGDMIEKFEVMNVHNMSYAAAN